MDGSVTMNWEEEAYMNKLIVEAEVVVGSEQPSSSTAASASH